MKRTTSKLMSYTSSFLINSFAFLLIVTNIANAQVKNNDIIYVSDDEIFHINESAYIFGALSAQSITTRSSSYGVFSFGVNALYSGETNDHFIDGYVRSYGSAPFIFPIGQSGVYAPAKVVSSAVTDVFDAAYFRVNPSTIGFTLDNSVTDISTNEFWHLKTTSTNTVVSLSWRQSSGIGVLTNNDLENLSIIGWDGSKWVQIPSTIDSVSFLGTGSDLNSGTITTDFPIQPSIYTAFTLGSKKGACAPIIASSGVLITYNDGWFPTIPTIRDNVQINTPYQAGSFSANTLELNADVTLNNGEYIDVNGSVTGNGKIIIDSESSFLQRETNGTPPKIELTKKTRAMRRYDYVYWGTPISENFLDQLNGAIAETSTLANAFDLKYKYISGIAGGWEPLDVITTGKGFITRVKNQSPFISDNFLNSINLKFSGVANNGDINVPVLNRLDDTEGPNSHNLLANPYPSAIDAEKFLRQNLDIDGAVYLWTSATQNTGGAYVQNDYAVWNLAGTVNTSPIPQNIDGRIASGQGFKVKALGTGTVTFTNCMRIKTGNDNFFRTSSLSSNARTTSQKDRFKLTMSNGDDIYSQIIIAYLPESTLGYDRLFDAGRNSVSSAQLYSIFEGDGRKLAINSRSLFQVNDVVNLGVSKSNTSSETFTVSISEREGIFNTDEVTVYLFDKLLGVYHDLAIGDYTFKTKYRVVNDRFQVVYQKKSIDPTEGNNNQFFVTIRDHELFATSQLEMTKIQVFDINGRKIQTYSLDNSRMFVTPFNHANAVYIAKIQFKSGTVASQKLINYSK